MAAPVITSPLTAAGVLHVPFSYRITATNVPDSFGATPLPAGYNVVTTTGKIFGRAVSVETVSVTISATNADGTGTATLVITITDGGVPPPPPDDTGIVTFPAKAWFAPDEVLDYADLDSAGQAIAQFEGNSIGTTELSADAIANKVVAIGGPGRIGQYVFPTDFVPTASALHLDLIKKIMVPGVLPSDPVIVGEVYNVDANGNKTNPAVNNSVFIGACIANFMSLYVFNGNGVTIPAGSVLNYRVFSFPTS
jgi:hypothetical protein